MNLGQLRSATRAQLDLETEDDLPTPLLDMYLQEAVNETVNLETRWPFLESAWVVYADAGSHTAVLPVGVRGIASVMTAQGTALGKVAHAFAEANMQGETGSPSMWSTWGNQLYLWPAPEEDAALQYSIRGWRAPAALSGQESAVPDIDERLHPSLVHYACSRVYAQQEDDELSNFYLQTWSRLVESARRAIMRPEYQGLWSMGGARRNARRAWVRFG
jgi:hypothetical protein